MDVSEEYNLANIAPILKYRIFKEAYPPELPNPFSS